MSATKEPRPDAPMSADELDARRAMLLSARIRFSPAGASVRDEAVDRIIEQSLANAPKPPLSPEAIADATRIKGAPQILTVADARAGLARLLDRGRVTEFLSGDKHRYGLSAEATKDVARQLDDAATRLREVTTTLFKSAQGDLTAYERAFLDLLCRVFSRMSSAYVAIMAGKDPGNGFVHTLLPNAIAEALKAHSVKDKEAFRHGATRFFAEGNPKFDAIKWSMAQHHYVVKALGVDPSARLLSSDLLNGATLYLDTNVLIAGLMPDNRHHGGIVQVIKACNSLRVNVLVAQITALELQRTVAAHATTLRRVYDRIPDATLPKVHCFLLEAYLAARVAEPDLTLDQFVDRFRAPLDVLRRVFPVEIDDDRWFDREAESPTTQQLATAIARKYETMRRRPKKSAAATHDALMLRWVEQKQKDTGVSARIVTLDLTLVAKDKEPEHRYAHVITLDALLQWTTPHCATEESADHLAAIYSAALRFQLLPTDFFDPRDFEVFADMEIETRHLPAEDVEACVRDIHRLGPSLDPGKAEDREKIAHEIQRHFADPGTKYKKELAALDAKNRELEAKVEQEQKTCQEARAEVATLKKNSATLTAQHRELQESMATEQAARKQAEASIADVQSELAALRRDVRNDELRSSVFRRLTAIAFALLVCWGGITWAAWKWGEGPNLFQKMYNAGWWYAIPPLLAGLTFKAIMGPERRKFLKSWKGEED
jgi:hypothetical protein